MSHDSSHDSSTRGAVVLVVDGDPAAGAAIAGVLEPHGHTVIATDTTSEALGLAQEVTFDIVFLREDLSGDVVSDLVRIVRLKQPQAVLAIIATEESAPPGALLSVAADRVLRAPFAADEVLSIVNHQLEHLDLSTIPRSPRILVVDDDQMVLESIRDVLEASYEVTTTCSPLEALGILKQRPVDILVADVMMQEMNGIDLVRSARTIRPRLVAVMMTGYGNKEVAVAAVKQGAFDFLEKPLTPSALVHSVERAWRLLRTELENRMLLVKLRRTNVELRQQIAERERVETELARVQKMEAIGLLAGGVAHDLNNVLAGMVSYPDFLLRGLPSDSPLRRPITRIKQSGEKAAAIVQDLLTLARRNTVTAETVNLNQVVKDFLDSPECHAIMLHHDEVRIEPRLAADLPGNQGAAHQLSTTVMNLVSNAAEAVSAGAVITISTEHLTLDQPLSLYERIPEGDYVVLSVKDTGTGISDDDMTRVFEPFYTKKVMGRSGTGLGMAVVWWTVKDCKGYVDIQSAPDRGTTIRLFFPALSGAAVRDRPPSEEVRRSLEGKTILVVDDVPEQREVTAEILTTVGYQVRAVASGEEALRYLGEHAVDLVILDMIMDPGIDGLETYRRILELHPGQRAILFSGYSETERIRQAQALGAGAFLTKPFTASRLLQAVSAELAR